MSSISSGGTRGVATFAHRQRRPPHSPRIPYTIHVKSNDDGGGPRNVRSTAGYFPVPASEYAGIVDVVRVHNVCRLKYLKIKLRRTQDPADKTLVIHHIIPLVDNEHTASRRVLDCYAATAAVRAKRITRVGSTISLCYMLYATVCLTVGTHQPPRRLCSMMSEQPSR